MSHARAGLLFGFALGWFAIATLGCSDAPPPPPGVSGAAEERGVVLLRYKPGSESTEQREEGFLATMQAEFADVALLSTDQFAGLTENESKNTANQSLIKYGDRVEGMFAVCEPNAAGTLRALEEKNMAGKVAFVGFDPNQRMVDALREKKMAGIVLQDPVTMGYLAVKTMVAHLDGQTVEKRVSTGEFVATPDNLDTDEMKRLLHPPKFSGTPFEPEETKYRIAVIPKGTSHEFWESVHFGAEKAAQELGNVQVIWQGPQSEGDVTEQINIVRGMVSKKVDGVCLAPNDSQSLVGAVREAREAGIDTVVFDSGLAPSYTDFVSYVATDNYNGGVLAARCLGAALAAAQSEAK
ncbi:MAG: substrate-binding domain-containing protein [Planctomycetales bacterium]|nr:substrate-binding domain-containing protein [Planctomycetales bacterium]